MTLVLNKLTVFSKKELNHAPSTRSDGRNGVPQVPWPYATEDFTDDDQPLELHPEA